MKYFEERREAILRVLSPPDNRPLPIVAAEEGISAPTVYTWCNQARAKVYLLPDYGSVPKDGTSRKKFSAVAETAATSDINHRSDHAQPMPFFHPCLRPHADEHQLMPLLVPARRCPLPQYFAYDHEGQENDGLLKQGFIE